jgi:hypothetical protein
MQPLKLRRRHTSYVNHATPPSLHLSLFPHTHTTPARFHTIVTGGCSLFPVPCSLFPDLCSLFPDL